MEKDNNDNKKTLILSIVGILVLVIAVVGVSFAMYTFTGTGTKTNVIKTGTISLTFGDSTATGATEENYFELDGTYPMTDATAATQEDNYADFSVNADWGSADMTIYYDLGIEIQGTPTLNPQYVKITLTDGTGAVVNNIQNVTLSSLASTAGPNNLITTYGLTGGTFTNSVKAANYRIRAWVSDQYDLAIDHANSTNPEDSDGTLNNQSGILHKKSTASETLSFKLKLVASQVQGS